MDYEDYLKADPIVKKIAKLQSTKKETLRKFDDFCMKNISYGQPYNEARREVLREFFEETKSDLAQKFDDKIKPLKEELEKV